MKKLDTSEQPYVIVPIPLDGYWGSDVDLIANKIIEAYEKYGLHRFSLAAPNNGQFNIGYADGAYYEKMAKKFQLVREKLGTYAEYIECGWWVVATLNTGDFPGRLKYVDINGRDAGHATCPFDERLSKEFPENLALFAKMAKPAFIVIEDDFNLFSGCFCEKHLNGFAEIMGKFYSREEIREYSLHPSDEGIKVVRKWREYQKQTLVEFAKVIRAKLDEESPEIPIGTHQPASSDFTGFCSEDVARAFAGDRHRPFSRIYAMDYLCDEIKQLPEIMYHMVYCKEHFGEDFMFLHESDTYPHFKFFCSANEMRTMMTIAYGYGFDGSVFWALPMFGHPDDELIYREMYAKEQKRFQALITTAKKCKTVGVQLHYDPFYYTIGEVGDFHDPLWTRLLGNFGIPYTTAEADVVFWDRTMASYADDETIMKCPSKGFILDGEAAKILCQRGYGRYLGVEMGEDSATAMGDFDQCSYELIEEGFVEGIGRTMANARTWCPQGNGVLLAIHPTDPECEVVSRVFTLRDDLLAVSMTRFENELGGRVVVMGTTLKDNKSQCLYNYPRQMLLQNLIKWCSDKYVFVRKEANIFCTMRECITNEFIGVLVIANLCSDDCEKLHLYFPEKWRKAKELMCLNVEGVWEPLPFEATGEGVIIDKTLRTNSHICIMAK